MNIEYRLRFCDPAVSFDQAQGQKHQKLVFDHQHRIIAREGFDDNAALLFRVTYEYHQLKDVSCIIKKRYAPDGTNIKSTIAYYPDASSVSILSTYKDGTSRIITGSGLLIKDGVPHA